MRTGPRFSQQHLSLVEVAEHHNVTTAALLAFYSIPSERLPERFKLYSAQQRSDELTSRLLELDRASTVTLLAAVEAVFRIDFWKRSQGQPSHPVLVTLAFQQLYEYKGVRVRLEDDILAGWKQHRPELKDAIGHLKDAFKYRHSLAHGRYWQPALGRRPDQYRFDEIYELAETVLRDLPLV